MKLPRYSDRNAKLTLASAFFSDLVFILPIWLLFSIDELGLSTLLATSLFMAVWLTSGILEIPAGALADRLRRKRMYLIGVALMSLYPLAYAFKLPILLILLISVVSGAGSALRSGTLIALTHESFKQEKRSDRDYHNFISTMHTFTFAGRALSGIAGGALYVLNPTAPFLALFVSYMLMFITGLFVVDTATERSKLSNRLHIRETLQQVRKAPLVIALFTIYIATQILGEAMWTAYQPFFDHDGLSASQIGVLFSGIAVVSGIGSYLLRFMMRRIGALKIEVIAGFLLVGAALLLNTGSVPFHVLAIVPAAFAAGISVGPLIATTQKFVASKFHTTAISIISVTQYIVYGLASLYVGLALDILGDAGTRQFLALEAGIITVVLVFIYARRRSQDMTITKNTDDSTDTTVAV